MMRGLFSGVSGLTEHQTRMDVIGNNIANVNTVGYKTSRVVFEDVVSQTLRGAKQPQLQSGGNDPIQVGLGVRIGSVDNIHTQGSLQSTGKPTDIAIEGNGFFVLGSPDTVGMDRYAFTRDGAFGLDGSSNLVNPSSGRAVLGWMGLNGAVNTSGPVTAVNIPLGSKVIAQASTVAALRGNLDASSAIGPGSEVVTSATLYDSLGTVRTITTTFTKTANNTWDWVASGAGITVGPANMGQLTFDAAGNLLGSTGNLELDNTATGANSPQVVTVDFTQISQFSSASGVAMFQQDGYSSGTLESFNIATDGTITGIYSNGVIRPLAQVALANFSNPAGLLKGGGSMYEETPNSGVPQLGTPGTNGRGELLVGTLEMSNVNLANEFTNMIVTERGFQANSKVITTSDEMLQELVNLKR
jgi:flagellar hook protein FlgE